MPLCKTSVQCARLINSKNVHISEYIESCKVPLNNYKHGSINYEYESAMFDDTFEYILQIGDHARNVSSIYVDPLALKVISFEIFNLIYSLNCCMTFGLVLKHQKVRNACYAVLDNVNC